MASPTVGATNTSSHASDVTTHTVSLPSGIIAGSLLMIFATVDGGPSVTAPAGWTKLEDAAFGGGGAKCVVMYKKAAGTEGASVDFTTSSAQASAHISARFQAHADVAVQAPQSSTAATGNSTAPDSGSLSPTGGSKDYLWVAYVSTDTDAAGQAVTAYPSGYTGSQINVQVAGAGGANVAICTKASTAASENPGPYTIANAEDWRAHTIAIHPGSDGVPPPASGGTAKDLLMLDVG